MELFDPSEHYLSRIGVFAQEPIVENQIVFLGDSITEAGYWDSLLGLSDTLNRGISGDTSAGVLLRLDEIVRRRPRKVFLMIGVNDIGTGVTIKTLAENVDGIIKRLADGSPNTEILLQSILPVNPNHPALADGYRRQAAIVETNILFGNIARKYGARFVELSTEFVNEDLDLDLKLTDDGLHLNEQGYRVWASYLIDNGLVS